MDVFIKRVTKSFEWMDVFIKRVTKSFERMDIFFKRVAKPFERLDVSIEWLNKPFERMQIFSNSFQTACKRNSVRKQKVVSVRFPVKGHISIITVISLSGALRAATA